MGSCLTILTPTGPAGMDLGNTLCPKKQNGSETSIDNIDIQDNKHIMAEEEPVLADPHTCLLAGVKGKVWQGILTCVHETLEFAP